MYFGDFLEIFPSL